MNEMMFLRRDAVTNMRNSGVRRTTVGCGVVARQHV